MPRLLLRHNLADPSGHEYKSTWGRDLYQGILEVSPWEESRRISDTRYIIINHRAADVTGAATKRAYSRPTATGPVIGYWSIPGA